MNCNTSFGHMRWIPFPQYYPSTSWNWNWTNSNATNASNSCSHVSQAWNEKTIIRGDEINKVPGLEHVVYPSSSYAAAVFGEYNLWGPPSQAELNFWNSLKTLRKKLAANKQDKSKVNAIAASGQSSKEDVTLKIQKEKDNEEQQATAGLGQEFKRLVLLRTQEEEVTSYGEMVVDSGSGFPIPTIDWPQISGEDGFQNGNYFYPPHGSRLYTYFSKSVEVAEGAFVTEEEENHEINENETAEQNQPAHAHASSSSSSFSSNDTLSRKAEDSCRGAASFSALADSSLQQLNEEIAQDVEVQELLKDERRTSKSSEKEKRRDSHSRDKECKKDKPVIEIREGDSLYGPNGEKREFLCVFCKGNNEPEVVYKSHPIRVNGIVMCPFLRNHTCVICKETGHTIKYCKNNKRGFFAMKSIGKADIFLTAEKNKLAEATTTALVEATNSGLIPQIVDDKENKKMDIQSQAKKKQSQQPRIPLASISDVINRGNPKDAVEAEYVPIGRYDVKNIPINASTQTSSGGGSGGTSNRRRVRRCSELF